MKTGTTDGIEAARLLYLSSDPLQRERLEAVRQVRQARV
jgi:hypothetical protein